MTVSHLKLAAFWIPLAWTTYMAFTPATGPSMFELSDKLLHCLAFGYLMIALWLAHGPRLGLAVAIAWLAGYGFAIEAIQAVLPYRDFSVLDLLADAVGLVAATTVIVQGPGIWAAATKTLRPAR